MAALEDAGVEIAFGLPGVHNLPLWDLLYFLVDPRLRSQGGAARVSGH